MDEIEIGHCVAHRAGILAAPAVDDDVARVLDAHNGAVHPIHIGIVLVHFRFAE